jgi:hypothetical protein
MAIPHARHELNVGTVSGFCDAKWFDHNATILGKSTFPGS